MYGEERSGEALTVLEAVYYCSLNSVRRSCTRPAGIDACRVEVGNMDEEVRNWVAISEYDLRTAEVLLAGGRWLAVLFYCQQALEKILKALIADHSGEMPRRIHGLVELAMDADVEISQQQKIILSDLTIYYVATRYPTQFSGFVEDIDKEVATKIVEQTKEMWKWLRAKLQ